MVRKFIEDLPQDFDNLGEVIYKGRNIVKIVSVNGIQLNVKSFKVPNVVNRFVYGNIRQSKASRSFTYANILIDNHINTPDPVAYIEEGNGLNFGRSYYISIHEEFDGLMREFKWGKLEGREELLLQFARFTASMHQKGIMHIDYSPGNILYKKSDNEYSFYLVDLNRMYFGNISQEKGCRNFCRLWGSSEMLIFIATEYAKARGFDQTQCVDMVLKYHQQFWKKFSGKYKEKTPYIAE